MEKLVTFMNYEDEIIIVFYDYDYETFYIYNEDNRKLVHKYNDLKNAFYWTIEYIDTNINENLKMDIRECWKDVLLDDYAESGMYEQYPTLFKALINN